MTPDKDCGVRISSAVAAIAQVGFDGMTFMNFWIFYLMPACGMALFQSLVVILMLVLDHHASVMKLNIQVGVEQAKGMHGVTCWRLGLCNMDFKYIMNRMGGPEFAEENWTCIRTMDGAHVQIDFILMGMRLRHVSSWNEFAIAIGLDHRCVHCILEIPGANPKQRKRKRTVKCWRPFLAEEQQPNDFQICVRDLVRNTPEITFADLQHFLFMAGFHYGACSANLAKFKASLRLTSLRRQRRQSQDTQIRKQLTFTTRELQKQEIGTWKLLRTVQFVASPHHFFDLLGTKKSIILFNNPVFLCGQHLACNNIGVLHGTLQIDLQKRKQMG